MCQRDWFSNCRTYLLIIDQICNLTDLRTEIHAQLQAVAPLAQEFVLGEVIPPAGDWSKVIILRDANYIDYLPAMSVRHTSV